MQMHALSRSILWWFCTTSLLAFVISHVCLPVMALPADNATTLQTNNNWDSNNFYGQALQSHPPTQAEPRMHQQNPGGTAAGNVQPANHHQKSMPSSRTAELSGKRQLYGPPQKSTFVGLEGAVEAVKPNFENVERTLDNRKYASAFDNTLENMGLNGPANPGGATAWNSEIAPIAMIPGSELGRGGGSLDVINDDSLFPKGTCCMNAQGFFDLANPPQCCKVNGVFLPFGPKPQCCFKKEENNNNNNNNTVGGGGGGGGGAVPVQSIGMAHSTTNGGGGAALAGLAANAAAAMASAANGMNNSAQADGQAKQSSRASAAGESGLRDLIFIIEDYTQYLINVANENAGAPCSARQPFKSYANVVWMVQQMYKHTYLPLALLFLLPGAVITQVKGLVGFGIFSLRDEDTVSPFAGIFRSVIAIFLIPATQLVVSYMIDIGNCCEEAVNKYVSMPLIFLWIEEQIVVFDPQQQGNLIKNIPNIPMSPLKGKFAGMPIKGAMMEQISGLDSALAELCNEAVHMLSIAMTVMSAFQIATVCYLFLVGPLAASFFAWPGVGRELFRRAFSSWVDAVVIVSLWKFWWCVVLAAWTIWLQQGINPFDPIGPHWLVCWMSILISVPFNPFEFKPSEIIQHVMMKAEAVAGKVAQSGKGGGSGGGGKAGKGGGGGGGGGGG